MEKLNEGLKTLNIELSEKQISALEKYIDSIMKFNESYNLMKADTKDDLAVNHILDSLSPYTTISAIIEKIAAVKYDGNKERVVVADIGSGGGCPGIPLAIAFPEIRFVLVERMEKRCEFLKMTVAELGLKNVKVECVQADKVKPESFDLEIFRAFHPFDNKIAKLLLQMLKPQGYIAAYKARSEKILAEMEEVKFVIPSYEKVTLTVPFLEDHERNLIVIQK